MSSVVRYPRVVRVQSLSCCPVIFQRRPLPGAGAGALRETTGETLAARACFDRPIQRITAIAAAYRTVFKNTE